MPAKLAPTAVQAEGMAATTKLATKGAAQVGFENTEIVAPEPGAADATKPYRGAEVPKTLPEGRSEHTLDTNTAESATPPQPPAEAAKKRAW